MPSTVLSIPAVAEMTRGTPDRMRKCSERHSLNTEAHPVAPGQTPLPHLGPRPSWQLLFAGGTPVPESELIHLLTQFYR
ncbi:MAG: hypothetical protein WAO35_26550 [Terriglobia bacterium]